MRQAEYIEITKVKAKLDALPDKPATKKTTSRYEAVKELKDSIIDLQHRGYTLDDIASNLSEGGLKIESPTLKAYMSRIRNEDKGNSKVTSKREQSTASHKSQVTPNKTKNANNVKQKETDFKAVMAEAENEMVTTSNKNTAGFIKPDTL